MNSELLKLVKVSKSFKVGTGFLGTRMKNLWAVKDVNLSLFSGEVLGLVGESGCGKSTLGRMAMQLLQPTSGEIYFKGNKISGLSRSEMRPIRRQMQIVFQDPVTSLNPRMSVGSILAEPFIIHKMGSPAEIKEKVTRLLGEVGLRPEHAKRFPHQFSGGQRQRIGIARALALKPELVVADEPVSALDVSIQAQVLNLLIELKERFGLTYLLVAHDLSVIRHISDRVAVMYLGKMVEIAPAEQFDRPPMHPYTQALLDAAPIADPSLGQEIRTLSGDMPSPLNPPDGCRFHTRCPECRPVCETDEPPLKEIAPSHLCACHFRGPERQPVREDEEPLFKEKSLGHQNA
jgi:oligopeptide/dipeptide ABC transporter ATP-binding protein